MPPLCYCAAMTAVSPDQRPNEDVLEFLRSAFEPEWREPPLGYGAIGAWESEHGVTLPEPYRTVIAEISNGCSLGPAEDGGLQPLGWLPAGWPGLGPRQPGALFPLAEGWLWEASGSVAPDGVRIADVYNRGSVVLGAEDGPQFWLLVTTGPRRGQVWLVTDVGAGPVPGDEAWGFLEWVRRWHAGDGWWD